MSEGASGEIVVYQRDDGSPAIEVRLDGDTVWLTQQQLADLFGTTQQNVSLHLKNIYEEGELDEAATHKDFLSVRREGAREVQRSVAHYNLDAVISVGYRVKSGIATRFRIWATERLREYLVKGFAMDDERLKELGGGRYWRELLERIRDIRSSEKVLYRQVLDLYATSLDYDPKAEETTEFFKMVQNKLHYAAHGHTAAEVIVSRADAAKPNMGLTTFAGERLRKSDVSVAKNYLDESELKKLNTLVSAYFDAAEFRAQNREPTYMRDWLAHLDRLIAAMDAPTLSNAGSVSHRQAVTKAEGEYEKYRTRIDAEPDAVERAYLESVKRAQRAIEGKDA
ncbi:MAG: virulence RhuM family protein [Microbacterium sp.]